MSASAGKLKRSRASLIGGIAVGLCVLVLCLLIARELRVDGILADIAGLAAAFAVGAWIRIADL